MATTSDIIRVKIRRVEELASRILEAVEDKGLSWFRSVEHAMLRLEIEEVKLEIAMYEDMEEFFNKHIN